SMKTELNLGEIRVARSCDCSEPQVFNGAFQKDVPTFVINDLPEKGDTERLGISFRRASSPRPYRAAVIHKRDTLRVDSPFNVTCLQKPARRKEAINVREIGFE